jgi:hypothetical protein
MKKIAVCIAVLLLMLAMTGCPRGSYIVIKGVQTNTAHSMAMRYDRFKGHKTVTVKVPEGEVWEVYVDISTDSGEIGLSITGRDGRSYYQEEELSTSSFTVTLEQAGKYDIRVDAEDHKGSYHISWGQQE